MDREVTKIVEAWDLIGAEGQFRIKGGRAIYDAVVWNGQEKHVRLARLDPTDQGLKQVNRYVGADTEIEVIRNYTEEAEAAEAAAAAESVRRENEFQAKLIDRTIEKGEQQ